MPQSSLIHIVIAFNVQEFDLLAFRLIACGVMQKIMAHQANAFLQLGGVHNSSMMPLN